MDSLDDEKMVYFKRKVFKRILVEKNAEDLIVLIWATGELKMISFEIASSAHKPQTLRY